MRFGDTWVSHQQHVYISSRPMQILTVFLLHPSEKSQCQCFLHLPMPIDRGSDAIKKFKREVGLLRKLLKGILIDLQILG